MSQKNYENVNAQKLANELAHLDVIIYAESDTSVRIVASDDVLLQVDEIVASHDATPIEAQPSEIDILKEQVASQQSIIDELLFEVIPSLLITDEEMI